MIWTIRTREATTDLVCVSSLPQAFTKALVLPCADKEDKINGDLPISRHIQTPNLQRC